MSGFGALVAVTGGWLAAHGAVDSGILPLPTHSPWRLYRFPRSRKSAANGRHPGSTRRVYSIRPNVAVADGAGVAGGARPALALDGVDFAIPALPAGLAGVASQAGGQTTALVGTSGKPARPPVRNY